MDEVELPGLKYGVDFLDGLLLFEELLFPVISSVCLLFRKLCRPHRDLLKLKGVLLLFDDFLLLVQLLSHLLLIILFALRDLVQPLFVPLEVWLQYVAQSLLDELTLGLWFQLALHLCFPLYLSIFYVLLYLSVLYVLSVIVIKISIFLLIRPLF